MTVISLKDYAAQNNISYEAVRQQVVRYKDELESHIIRDGRQQFLDEEAVAFLDGKRQKNPVAIIQQSKDDAIEELRLEREQLLLKVAAQADKISELAQWKADNALAISGAAQTQLLLDTTKAELVQAKLDNTALVAENKEIQEKAQQIIQETQRRAEEEQSAKDAEIDDLKRKLEAAQQKNQELEDRGLGDYLKRIFTKKRKG